MKDKYKILALDIDGTVLNSKKELTPAVDEAIKSLQKRNIPVLIASGRPAKGIYHVAEALHMDETGGYILSFNGGKILDFKTKDVIYSRSIDSEYYEEICEYVSGMDASLITYDKEEIITEKPDNEYVQFESRIVRMPVIKVDNLVDEMKKRGILADKFLVVGEPEYITAQTTAMKKKFEGRLNVFQSEPFFIEVVPLGIDKAASLEILLQKLGLTREELIACGDGRNDVTMVKYAGMGVAMENACDEVKEVADYITASCDEDGVARVIERFFPMD